jgi:hypothetical protein
VAGQPRHALLISNREDAKHTKHLFVDLSFGFAPFAAFAVQKRGSLR